MSTEKICDSQKCTLCMACVNSCPTKAIQVTADEFGFEKLSIEQEKCIDCGLCSKICKRRDDIPRNHPQKCYAAQMSDFSALKRSASGGAFQAIAEIILEKGGICYGAELIHNDNEFDVRHTRVVNLEGLKRILNSKYIPSIIGEIYKQAKQDLENDNLVLFSGTPCLILGLKAYLGKEYEKLLTVDLVCHGVTATKIFNDYVKEVEKTKRITIVDYQFRDKSISWGTNYCYSYYNSDSSNQIKIRHCPREESSYMTHYLRGHIFRENCYSCSLSNTLRVSDFTLGDYWEIEVEHPEFVTKMKPSIILRKGVSCVLANTEQALKYMPDLRSKMTFYEVSLETIVKHNGNLQLPSKKGKGRAEFLNTYKANGYSLIEKQFQANMGKKIYIYRIKNALKAHLPDRVRIWIYNTPRLRRILFH